MAAQTVKTKSAGLTVTIERDFTGKLDDLMVVRARAIVYKTVFDIEAQAKMNATGRPGPQVDTGTLRASIRAIVDPHGLTGRVVVGAEYGAYVEYGTVRAPAYPYFTPAIEHVKPAHLEACRQLASMAGVS